MATPEHAFKKGSAKPAASGRKPGVANKTTRKVRAIIAEFADAYAPRFVGWVDRIARDDPKSAADLYLRALEYHLPKIGRVELTGEDGGAIKGAITFTFVPLPSPHASKTIDVTPGKRDA